MVEAVIEKPVGTASNLTGKLYMVAGERLTHGWDASAYLIAGDEPALIDCGSSEGYPLLKQNLKQLGYEPRDIRKVFLTHGHYDHVTGLVHLREDGANPEVYIHTLDREQVETGDLILTSAFLYDRPFPPVKIDHELHDGDVLKVGDYDLHVYHTPGHSPGCVSYGIEIDGVKILIAGDTLWGGYHPKVHSSLEDWERSLAKLEDLHFDALTHGHLCPPNLLYNATERIHEARLQFNVYFNPWFRPFHTKFQYTLNK